MAVVKMSRCLVGRVGKSMRLRGVLTCGLLLFAVAGSYAEDRVYVQNGDGERPEPIVAVENVCAWPNLTMLRDGTIVATIHNQPSHLKMPADVECWASSDGGLTWAKRGTPAPRDNPQAARGNVAAGLARNGDLVVIVSGWSDPAGEGRGSVLLPWVSRSSDGGHTWDIDSEAFSRIAVPFGDVLEGADGRLHVAVYGGEVGEAEVYSSRDDGKTWGKPVSMDKNAVIHEPALFYVGGGRWIAATRLNGLDLYTSDDDAGTWKHQKKLTAEQRHPGHFAQLEDGTIVLSYGNRVEPKGVDVRFSDDDGMTWSEPFRVVDFQGDGGYPSSVPLADGRIVTAYYARQTAAHDGYHMGVVIWDPVMTGNP